MEYSGLNIDASHWCSISHFLELNWFLVLQPIEQSRNWVYLRKTTTASIYSVYFYSSLYQRYVQSFFKVTYGFILLNAWQSKHYNPEIYILSPFFSSMHGILWRVGHRQSPAWIHFTILPVEHPNYPLLTEFFSIYYNSNH